LCSHGFLSSCVPLGFSGFGALACGFMLRAFDAKIDHPFVFTGFGGFGAGEVDAALFEKPLSIALESLTDAKKVHFLITDFVHLGAEGGDLALDLGPLDPLTSRINNKGREAIEPFICSGRFKPIPGHGGA